MALDGSLRSWRAAEFFAGIGLARLGLERAGFDVVWSNDIARAKQAMFEKNFGTSSDHTFVLNDLGKVTLQQLPRAADVAWASFPCTDLSAAGARAGLHRGTASSTFWHFIKAMSKLGRSRPRVVAIENVTAFATSHSGKDIASAIRALNGLGYSVDVLSVDARRFLPQSRPRIFLVGTSDSIVSSSDSHPLRPAWLDSIFNDPELVTHRMRLPSPPPLLDDGLADYVEWLDQSDVRWWEEGRTQAFLESLSDLQRARLQKLVASHTTSVRTAYRRMRAGVPRWELRSDGVAGCLRTSSGGSSKQAVVFMGHGSVSVRWMTPREYARLMGAPDFPLDGVRPHHAYSGFGDAVCAPVVEWLAANYLAPVLGGVGTFEPIRVDAALAP